jgi:hypothetical protein
MTDLAYVLVTVAFFVTIALVARRAAARETSVNPLGRRR